MKLPSLPPVSSTPLNRGEFLREFGKFLGIQLACVLPGIFILLMGSKQGSKRLEFTGLFVLFFLQSISGFVLGRNNLFQRRIVDIYPALPKITKYWAYIISPISIVLTYSFLILSRSKRSLTREAILFRKPKIAAFIACVVYFGPLLFYIPFKQSFEKTGSLKRLAYWTSGPTAQYLSLLDEDVRLTTQAKKIISQANGTAHFSPIEVINSLKSDYSLTSTGLILESAIVVQYYMSLKKKMTTENASEFDLKFGISANLFDDLVSILENGNSSSNNLALDFNPVLYLIPGGGFEIALVSIINESEEFHFQQTYISHLEIMAKQIQDNLIKLHLTPEVRKSAEARLATAINRLKSTYYYKEYKSNSFSSIADFASTSFIQLIGSD